MASQESNWKSWKVKISLWWKMTWRKSTILSSLFQCLLSKDLIYWPNKRFVWLVLITCLFHECRLSCRCWLNQFKASKCNLLMLCPKMLKEIVWVVKLECLKTTGLFRKHHFHILICMLTEKCLLIDNNDCEHGSDEEFQFCLAFWMKVRLILTLFWYVETSLFFLC